MAALWWAKTIGFIVCLGFVGGVIFHFLGRALHSEDAVRIDNIDDDLEE